MSFVMTNEMVALVRIARFVRGMSPYHLRNVPVAFGRAVSVTVVPGVYVPSSHAGQSLVTSTASSKNVSRSIVSLHPPPTAVRL